MAKFIAGLLLGIVIGIALIGPLSRSGKEKLTEVRGTDGQSVLSRYGIVMKEKAKEAGAAIADATADSRATAAIKAKLLTELSASTITGVSVSTSDGVVTLAGTVSSTNDIHKAVEIAYATDGVQKVYSTLQVKTGK